MRKLFQTITVAILVAVLLQSCSFNMSPHKEVEKEDVDNTVREWFLQKHSMEVTVESTSPLQVGEKTWLTEVTVSAQNNRFELVLDESYQPIADNVYGLQTIQTVERQDIFEQMRSIKYLSKLGIEFCCPFYDNEHRYRTQCAIHVNEIPEEGEKDFWWSILQELNRQGIDDLIILIETPEFLRLYGGHQLEGEYFPTVMNIEDFNLHYSDLINRVYWDEAKFNAKLKELSDAGFGNPRFYISGFENGLTLNITLLYEAGDESKAAEDLLETMLKDMDSSYFYLSGLKIRYVIKRAPLSEPE